jgi:hypothetical protein
MDVATSPIFIPYLFYDSYFCTWTGIWDLSVGVRIRVQVEISTNCCSVAGRFKIFFCPPTYSGYFWVPTQPSVQWVKVAVLAEIKDRNDELTVHPNPEQRPRMIGNPHLPLTPS